MNRPGHYGIALVVYSPIGGVVAILGYETIALIGGVIVVSLSMLPDYDHHVPTLEHRGLTHTVAFALFVGIALAAGAAMVAEAQRFESVGFTGFAFLVGTLSILSHVLGDAITPAGVRPFWPLSKRWYTLSLVRSSDRVVNYALFATGVLVVAITVSVTHVFV